MSPFTPESRDQCSAIESFGACSPSHTATIICICHRLRPAGANSPQRCMFYLDREDREAIWSIPPTRGFLYFTTFTILSLIFVSYTIWFAMDSAESPYAILPTVGRYAAPLIIVSAGISLIFTHWMDYIMLYRNERRIRLKEREDALREEGREEVRLRLKEREDVLREEGREKGIEEGREEMRRRVLHLLPGLPEDQRRKLQECLDGSPNGAGDDEKS